MNLYKYRVVSTDDKHMLERLTGSPEKASQLVYAIERGQQIVIKGSGDRYDRCNLIKFLNDLGASVIDGSNCLVIGLDRR